MSTELKKLNILETNNYHLNYKAILVYDKPMAAELIQLREYVEESIRFDPTDDPKVIFDVLGWVSKQWKHHGLNDPGKETSSLEILKRAKNGERFRCVEYGKVTSDILLSYGITSRKVSLRTENFDYGGVSMGHVATEVWSNGLEKWIFIDPQFGAYFIGEGVPLNFYELYKFYCTKGSLNELKLIADSNNIDKTSEEKSKFKQEYIDFLTNYFGYIASDFSSDFFNYNVYLKLNGKRDAMTFQGLALEDVSYTSDVEELYFGLNQSIMTFTYKEKKDFMKLINEIQISSKEEYIENMHRFASEPDLTVKCYHNTPRFDYFEYSFDMKNWIRLEKDTFEWKITEGVQNVYLRSINKQGLKGIICYIKVEYK